MKKRLKGLMALLLTGCMICSSVFFAFAANYDISVIPERVFAGDEINGASSGGQFAVIDKDGNWLDMYGATGTVYDSQYFTNTVDGKKTFTKGDVFTVPDNNAYYYSYKAHRTRDYFDHYFDNDGTKVDALYLEEDTPIEYTVIYDGNGGSLKDSAVTGEQKMTVKDVENGTVYLSDGMQFSYEDKKFVGWNSMKDGSGVSFAAGSKATTDLLDLGQQDAQDPSKAEIILYAQWEDVVVTPIEYTVIYDANGGNLKDSAVTGEQKMTVKDVENGTVYLSDGTQLAYEGKEFVGWNSMKDGSGVSFAAGSKATTDLLALGQQDAQDPSKVTIVLYAQWKDVEENKENVSPKTKDNGAVAVIVAVCNEL